MSLPVRGAWIEIYILQDFSRQRRSRSPCGERGLKSSPPAACRRRTPSLPVRGAWIEMRLFGCANDTLTVAPRAGSVD